MLTWEPRAWEHRETGIRVRVTDHPRKGWTVSWESYGRSGEQSGFASYQHAIDHAEALYPVLERHAAMQEAYRDHPR